MKLQYILPIFLLTVFTGCLEEDEILKAILGEPVAVQDGDYATDCEINGSDSLVTHLNISGGATSRDIQIQAFTGVTDCSSGEVLGTVETASIELASFGFGNNVSFFTEQNPTLGELRVPYHVDGNGDLYLGVSADDLGADPADLFGNFITSPTTSGGKRFIPVP